MATINISLPDKLKIQADDLVDQGYYVSFSDLIRTALRDLMSVADKSLETICVKNNIEYLGLFGSFARGEVKKDSDVDLLVKFKDNAGVGLFELVRLEKELTEKLGRKVELITKLNKHVKEYAQKDMITLYEER